MWVHCLVFAGLGLMGWSRGFAEGLAWWQGDRWERLSCVVIIGSILSCRWLIPTGGRQPTEWHSHSSLGTGSPSWCWSPPAGGPWGCFHPWRPWSPSRTRTRACAACCTPCAAAPPASSVGRWWTWRRVGLLDTWRHLRLVGGTWDFTTLSKSPGSVKKNTSQLKLDEQTKQRGRCYREYVRLGKD